MSGVFSKSFRTDLSLDRILAELRLHAGLVEWQIRDSEYDGRYIRGQWGETGIRIVDYGASMSCEIYLADAAAREQIARYVMDTVLPALGARDTCDG
jgi:hypothetical protein